MQIERKQEAIVHSSDAEVESRIKRSVRSVSESRLGNALLTEYRGLAYGLKKVKRRDGTDLSISYCGKTIEFTLNLRNFNYLNEHRAYMNSNEAYSIFTARDMRMLEGLEHYAGVSGGLTQVLTQVALLQEKNDISTVKLCDLKQEFSRNIGIWAFDSDARFSLLRFRDENELDYVYRNLEKRHIFVFRASASEFSGLNGPYIRVAISNKAEMLELESAILEILKEYRS